MKSLVLHEKCSSLISMNDVALSVCCQMLVGAAEEWEAALQKMGHLCRHPDDHHGHDPGGECVILSVLPAGELAPLQVFDLPSTPKIPLPHHHFCSFFEVSVLSSLSRCQMYMVPSMSDPRQVHYWLLSKECLQIHTICEQLQGGYWVYFRWEWDIYSVLQPLRLGESRVWALCV